jgi:hypothetical protein
MILGELCKENVFVDRQSACYASIAVHHTFPILAQGQRYGPSSECDGRQVLIHSFYSEVKQKCGVVVVPI